MVRELRKNYAASISKSNFQQEIFELYHELLAFGTSAMFITDDIKDD